MLKKANILIPRPLNRDARGVTLIVVGIATSLTPTATLLLTGGDSELSALYVPAIVTGSIALTLGAIRRYRIRGVRHIATFGVVCIGFCMTAAFFATFLVGLFSLTR